MKKLSRRTGTLALVLCALFFNSCNFATHSYNTGKLLDPGETMSTISAGSRTYFSVTDSLYFVFDSLGEWVNERHIPLDTLSSNELSLAFDFRLGVLSRYPFGKGLEIGFLIETPTQSYSGLTGVPILQFDGRFGLPDAAPGKRVWHHNAGAGWVLGQWVDNSWFIEYAGGIEYRTVTPYCNFRITRVATDRSTSEGGIFVDDRFLTVKKTWWNIRVCSGVSFTLPVLPLLPDFIVPELSLIYPNLPVKVPLVSWHVGLRWLNDK